jgi:uncharacterized protein (UPF0335 family)
MKDLFIANLDIVDYVMNNELDKVASVVSDLRDNAQKAYIPSFDELNEKEDKDFALILVNSKNEQLRKFACYNEDLTELNMAFLVQAMNDLPEEVIKTAATNLTAAANKFGIMIPEELNEYASKKFASRIVHVDNIDLNKYASKCKTTKQPSKKFALGNKYPIDTKKELQKAAEWFSRNAGKLSIDEQLEFIENVVTESKQQNFDINSSPISKYASLDYESFNEDLFNHISVRKSLVKEDQEDLKETYNDALRRADELGPMKLAYVIEAIDKEAGLDYYYGKNIVEPIQAVFGEVKLAGVDIDGVKVTLDQIKKLNKDQLTELVGNGTIKELYGKDGLAVLASLPRPIRAEILNMMK